MNNLPRQALRRILAKHGNEVCGDAGRCENLLKDSCGSYRREINVLVAAVEDRVPMDLLAANRSMPQELLLTRLEKRLEEQTAMTREAARWAVESWALALNVATDAEIEARRKQSESSPPNASAGTLQPDNSADGGNISNVNRTNPASRPKAQNTAPPQKVNPPVVRQPTKTPSPTKMPTRLPPVFSPTNNPPAVQPPIQAPATNPQLRPPNPAVIPKNRFGVLRGCLLVIFLFAIASVVLFFGVPYAIEVMRETQREKSVEPPRFPAR